MALAQGTKKEVLDLREAVSELVLGTYPLSRSAEALLHWTIQNPKWARTIDFPKSTGNYPYTLWTSSERQHDPQGQAVPQKTER
ncbi:hypothetical protein KXD40_003182 [Peronospora effusa]|uniref:Uncharacterized protein n=1 Tax=Peronospora effusa TaxID=542832 RepID=A0A3M6VJP6_9STRA|nr:hypothetical protein DD238_004978 [Peronospora effusa]RQM13980.1 hypothetical protein DD237_005051 [Peronospora effusa]UIZ29672.1 hypothetical protein KXD40_003182 [Peronospora effusa]